MRIKIVSDGTSQGTKVIDEATGEALHYVSRIEWELIAGAHIATAHITVLGVPVEITTEATVSEA
jgi:hypothetical protein